MAAISIALLGMIAVGSRVRAVVHQPDPQAEARHAGSGRRPARHARRHPDGRRVRRARRRLQHDGGPSRRASGKRQAPGAAGDVRPDRGGPRARPVASDSEHRQQRAPDRPRRCRPGDARDVPADSGPGAPDASSGSSTTCATSPSRGRSSGSRWTSTHRSRRSSIRCARRASGTASPSRRTTPRNRSSSTATGSRSAACTAT